MTKGQRMFRFLGANKPVIIGVLLISGFMVYHFFYQKGKAEFIENVESSLASSELENLETAGEENYEKLNDPPEDGLKMADIKGAVKIQASISSPTVTGLLISSKKQEEIQRMRICPR